LDLTEECVACAGSTSITCACTTLQTRVCEADISRLFSSSIHIHVHISHIQHPRSHRGPPLKQLPMFFPEAVLLSLLLITTLKLTALCLTFKWLARY
jgi:hypothetical protein